MPMDASGGVFGPVAALAAVGLLALARRVLGRRDDRRPPREGLGPPRVLGRGDDRRARREGLGPPRVLGRGDDRRPPGEDFGLLRVAAVAADRAGAEAVRGLLAAAGIRATVAGGACPGVRVLVFAEDLERARAVVSGPAT